MRCGAGARTEDGTLTEIEKSEVLALAAGCAIASIIVLLVLAFYPAVEIVQKVISILGAGS